MQNFFLPRQPKEDILVYIIMENTLTSFEYIDRDYDRKAILIEQFEKITSKDQLKVGDRFICPRSPRFRNGVVDATTEIPILMYKSSEKFGQYHIAYALQKYEIGTRCPGIAWDLCYRMRDDI